MCPARSWAGAVREVTADRITGTLDRETATVPRRTARGRDDGDGELTRRHAPSSAVRCARPLGARLRTPLSRLRRLSRVPAATRGRASRRRAAVAARPRHTLYILYRLVRTCDFGWLARSTTLRRGWLLLYSYSLCVAPMSQRLKLYISSQIGLRGVVSQHNAAEPLCPGRCSTECGHHCHVSRARRIGRVRSTLLHVRLRRLAQVGSAQGCPRVHGGVSPADGVGRLCEGLPHTD